MEKIFDMHCHILPHVDDGAKKTEDAMNMLEIAYKDGISGIIATPHFHPRRGQKSGDVVKIELEKLQNLAKERFPDMEIYGGHEVYHCHDAVDKLKAGEILTLNDSSYCLVEFSFTEDVRKITRGLNKMLMNGFDPILAHVERYVDLAKDWNTLESLCDAGVYLQINAESLLGKTGHKRKSFVKKLLKSNMVSFIGTDAHDTRKRTPELSKAAAYVEKKFGKETAHRIFVENPRCVVENKMI